MLYLPHKFISLEKSRSKNSSPKIAARLEARNEREMRAARMAKMFLTQD